MATRAEVEVLPTREALMEAAAARFVSAAGAALRASGRFVVALAGGSTPKALYALLAGAPWAGRVDWSRVHVFWGDERCVPPDDPASNYRMTREALLAHVPVSERHVHRIRGEDDPRRAAAAYERVLREMFATPVGPPRHAPGARFYLDAVGMWRVTLTPVVLNAAAEVAFLVSGAEKAPMLRRVLEGPHEPDALPAQVVAPHDGRLRWLVDAPAAARLDRR